MPGSQEEKRPVCDFCNKESVITVTTVADQTSPRCADHMGMVLRDSDIRLKPAEGQELEVGLVEAPVDAPVVRCDVCQVPASIKAYGMIYCPKCKKEWPPEPGKAYSFFVAKPRSMIVARSA